MTKQKNKPDADEAPVLPDRLTEEPPADRFCDLVLTGGIASGVVYPWAILEIARAYRLKSIGGTSVGAMAAAIAAAAEFGRRYGFKDGFEVLRLLPCRLAEPKDGGTRMRSLFQPSPGGRRLFALMLAVIERFLSGKDRQKASPWTLAKAITSPYRRVILSTLAAVAAIHAIPIVAVLNQPLQRGAWSVAGWTLCAVFSGLIAVLAVLACAIARDIRKGIIDNDHGLCAGGTVSKAGDTPALVEWLHEGIQKAAGLKVTDRPLTFRDLWNAPLQPGDPPKRLPDDARPSERSINLEMITTNVTHGRPYRLPLQDESSRLYFRRAELEKHFTPHILDALVKASTPYRPGSPADPPRVDDADLLEMPGADMPIVVAARLSLSFPVLFSTVPLHAIDYELEWKLRKPRRCRFSDGGICSNFPVHLFDAAIPTRPTFGMWLGRRSPHRDLPVWLPLLHTDGRGDSWERFEGDRPAGFATLFGFLLGVLKSAKDWSDRSSMRMPHVRNRVARLGLLEGEGELNIAMNSETILHMAHAYGTAAGRKFVDRFAGDAGGARRKAAWDEHRWVRFQVLLQGMRDLLNGLGAAAFTSNHATSLEELIRRASTDPPLREYGSDRSDGIGADAADELQALLCALVELENQLQRHRCTGPYHAIPTPELRVRPPL